eukprot:CAMPEP_0194127766 /NCGR_PEP_ID=MMETSP0150-20130528/60694_1 /TAXON_ID=122233 /ORGANISM="Chaetoceros debilis, Strain MM31A-1" /LENGTH=350 /DNA_ID=CAMNT_0038821711 /DNA_START=236 /DNA_END=1288 /DNA_ORIENTATION=+
MTQLSRFQLWVSYFWIVLVVCYEVNYVLQNYNNEEDAVRGETAELDAAFGVAMAMMTLLLSGFMTVSHMHEGVKATVVGSKIEGIIIALVLTFSVVSCALTTGPARGLAVDRYGGLIHGNMYYLSWFAFANGLYLASRYLNEVYGINFVDRVNSQSSTFSYWLMLLISSIIIIAASVELRSTKCAEIKDSTYCSRTILGITVGAVAAIASSATLATKLYLGAVPFLGEVGIIVLVCIFYVFEVIFVTDGAGPGAPIGNLYYCSWISLLLCIKIMLVCHETYTETLTIMEQGSADTSSPHIDDTHENIQQSSVVRESETSNYGKVSTSDASPGRNLDPEENTSEKVERESA